MSALPDEGDGFADVPSAPGSDTDEALRRLSMAAAATGSGPEGAGNAVAGLCRPCVDLLDITGVSVSLSGGDDVRALWWSSDETAGRLAEAQYTLGDGPSHSAMELMAPVLAADLTSGTDALRWPVFAQQAVELGVRAVFSLPLSPAGILAMGTLDLYRRDPGPLSESDRALAFPAADAITDAFLALGNLPGGEPGRWLDAAENGHEEVHQATGMLMVFLELDPQQALARLRAHAFARGQSVTEAARDVIAGRETLRD
ncbi:ANTAR domain-containing protein [Streptomyces sp. ISL-94]|uniref:GAF and ANTAR domain-containing protein n=1 Tax=Streptomyces sp. ISL-94 TaxID=2819190 RepID=UPI001BEC3221|nr:ANTAR domain-containing protein [Streptomyces sp. ISL-94]MBT2478847.1 ANTAR domain-containing protein [Streptomyces sp. ISL-94]